MIRLFCRSFHDKSIQQMTRRKSIELSETDVRDLIKNCR